MGFARNFTKRRYIVCGSVFFVLVGRLWHLHYERNQLWGRIKQNYQVDRTSKNLRSGEVARFLRDNGVNLTKEQFVEWFGNVDNEGDGFDQEELSDVAEILDDLGGAGKVIQDASHFSFEWGPVGGSFLVDCFLTIVAGAGLLMVLQNADQIEARWAATAFGSAVKVSRMNKKGKDLRDQIQAYDEQKQEMETKMASLRDASLEANNRAKELQEETQTVKKRASVLELAAQEAKDAEERVQQQCRELEAVRLSKEKAEADLVKLRGETEQHIMEAHMSTSKLQAMQRVLKTWDAVGAASPFKGAGAGKYKDAKVGFSVKGVETPRPPTLSRSKSGSVKVAQAPPDPMGFHLETSVFGFPDPENNEIVLFEVNKKRDLLGHGADCAYKCRDISTRQEYALKIYDMKGDKQKKQIINDLNTKKFIETHPNIVQYHQVIETEDQIYVLMELIPGVDLFGMIIDSPSGTGLEEPIAARLFAQICMAVEFVHSKEIVHGDIKPENVMVLNAETEEPHAKLIDFGFSCFLRKPEPGEEAAPKSQAVFDAYSTPEGLERKPVTRAGDLWRLGCMLYVMLNATVPFDQDARDLHQRRMGKFNKYEKWSALSSGAKEIITGLLKGPEEERMPISEILIHPWIMEHAAA